MGLLEQLKGRYKVLSIVGMAKNAGKTTALNYILEEAMDEGMLLGVTSTGRDGESSDLVTGTEKPRVFLDAGTLVSVPTQLYEMADAGLEILKMTDYSTAIGDLMICRVADSGYVQIAGPLNIQAHKKLCREMLDMGAEMILIGKFLIIGTVPQICILHRVVGVRLIPCDAERRRENTVAV